MSFLSVTRLIVFVVTLLFSLAVLGLAGHLLSTNNIFDFLQIPDFEALALASAVISLASLVPLLIIGLIRKGAIVNIIAIELPVLSVLWVLWVATSARDVAWRAACDFSTVDIDIPDIVTTYCRETAAVEGIAFVIWIFMMFYIIALFSFVVVAMTRGNNKIWTTTVGEADFFAQPNYTMDPSKPQPYMQPVGIAPVYQQPQYQYGQPQYIQPQYVQQPYGQPQYVQQPYGQQPQFVQQPYGQPQYVQQQYSPQPQPVQPQYSGQPVSNGTPPPVVTAGSSPQMYPGQPHSNNSTPPPVVATAGSSPQIGAQAHV